jgi:hypothetical protein
MRARFLPTRLSSGLHPLARASLANFANYFFFPPYRFSFMNEALALKLLRRIMQWNEEAATREYRWIRLMSELKYDGYRDYVAGVRFAESLAGWLRQFDATHREAAYDFVKHRLIYFSPLEINRLVDQLYPRFIEPKLRRSASTRTGIAPYLVMSNMNSKLELLRERRRTLFIGLSDGARLDILRRANAGVLVNDQIVLATHIDEDKWKDLGAKLREDKIFEANSDPKFDRVCLVDDFTGSGTSFLRQRKDGSWTGKLRKFGLGLSAARNNLDAHFPLTDDFSLHIHHYILRIRRERRSTSGSLQSLPLSERMTGGSPRSTSARAFCCRRKSN